MGNRILNTATSSFRDFVESYNKLFSILNRIHNLHEDPQICEACEILGRLDNRYDECASSQVDPEARLYAQNLGTMAGKIK